MAFALGEQSQGRQLAEEAMQQAGTAWNHRYAEVYQQLTTSEEQGSLPNTLF